MLLKENSPKKMLKIAIIIDDEYESHCKKIAVDLNLPLCSGESSDYDYYLFFVDGKLALKSSLHEKFNPIIVDFLSGKLFHRYQYGGGRGQLIAKACGVKAKEKPIILDLTAGLGQDAFVLAALGCDVTMIERSPFIGALLQDGLSRAREQDWFAQLSLKLIITDAKQYLSESHEKPDVIYLDPMFPESKKTALVKKEMQILREIVEDNSDAESLLELAIQKADKKIVVKRPRLAPTLSNRNPNLTYEGKSNRFDVYIPKAFHD